MRQGGALPLASSCLKVVYSVITTDSSPEKSGAAVMSMLSACVLFGRLRLLDLPVLLLKLLDGLADKVDHFAVGGAALVLRNIVQFIVKLAVDAQPEMLVLFLLQRVHAMPSMYLIKDNLSLFQVHDRMCKVYSF